jgi:salicylate hydroxylase
VEDAAVLGNLFSHLSAHSQITPLLHAYQSIRYARTAETQASSRLNQHIFHLQDGEEQERRDKSMLEAWLHSDKGGGNANQWADQVKNMRQFGYDADEEAEKWWNEEGEHTVGILARARL